MDTGYRKEDLKGAALLLSERSLLKTARVIFHIIFFTQRELISFPLLDSPSEDRLCVTDTNQNKNGIMPFIFMFHLKCNSREVEYHINVKKFALENNSQVTY